MIGRLSGTLVIKQPPQLMVDVHGVGYELEAPMSTVYELPAVGQPVVLFVHQQVREDAVNLYGFHREAERALFRTLLKVSGVGAKTALAILSGASADEFARLVRNGEITALTRIPGIGKKTAERIVVELRDRVDGIGGGGAGGVRRRATDRPGRRSAGRARSARLQAGRGRTPRRQGRRRRRRRRGDHPQGAEGRAALNRVVTRGRVPAAGPARHPAGRLRRHRPHDALGGMTPAEFRQQHTARLSASELSA